MSRRPFDPSELDQPSTDAERASSELESYVATTATGAPRGLEQRVMAAVEREPAPRRGFLAWLLTPPSSGSGIRSLARATVLAATLVLAVGGALFAGQLADIVRHVGTGSPTPTETVSPTPTESVAPTLTTSPGLTASGSPTASEDPNESPEPSGTPEATEHETPEASAGGTAEDSKTPRPSRTPSPNPTPTHTP
jgi:hypothetical protein